MAKARSDKATGLLSRGIYLEYSENGTSWTAIPDLQEIPDLGQAPETIEVTTLEDGAKRYIKGLQDYGSLDFVFLYSSVAGSGYQVCREIEAKTSKTHFQVKLPDGTTCKFLGELSTRINGIGTNDAIKFTASIAISSDMEITVATGDGNALEYATGPIGG